MLYDVLVRKAWMILLSVQLVCIVVIYRMLNDAYSRLIATLCILVIAVGIIVFILGAISYMVYTATLASHSYMMNHFLLRKVTLVWLLEIYRHVNSVGPWKRNEKLSKDAWRVYIESEVLFSILGSFIKEVRIEEGKVVFIQMDNAVVTIDELVTYSDKLDSTYIIHHFNRANPIPEARRPDVTFPLEDDTDHSFVSVPQQ